MIYLSALFLCIFLSTSAQATDCTMKAFDIDGNEAARANVATRPEAMRMSLKERTRSRSRTIAKQPQLFFNLYYRHLVENLVEYDEFRMCTGPRVAQGYSDEMPEGCLVVHVHSKDHAVTFTTLDNIKFSLECSSTPLNYTGDFFAFRGALDIVKFPMRVNSLVGGNLKNYTPEEHFPTDFRNFYSPVYPVEKPDFSPISHFDLNSVNSFEQFLNSPPSATEDIYSTNTAVASIPPTIYPFEFPFENPEGHHSHRSSTESSYLESESLSPEPLTVSAPTVTKKRSKHPNLTSNKRTVTLSLENSFSINQFPGRAEKQRLAEKTGWTIEKIETWFINKRGRIPSDERFTFDIREILKASFNTNQHPDEEELQRLARNTGLPLKRIKPWFTKRRKEFLEWQYTRELLSDQRLNLDLQLLKQNGRGIH